jgi:16S rRNA (adenine1518-N6/adenine1519-N6)-dimethyltransferase
MNENKVRAKKQFGQHFLKSEKAINDVVNCLNSPETKTVIEIGPGMGVLTKALLEKGFQVFAIEIDKESIKYLQENFTEYIKDKKLIIIDEDFLELDIDGLLVENFPPYYLVGNIPYYITGLIFRKSFSMKHLPKKVVYLVQKEVADRTVARDKKESILSMSIKYFGIPKIISIVKAGSFNPPPKVDSAILEISNIMKQENEQLFFTLIKTAFLHKRKNALSNIKKYLLEANVIDINLWDKIKENISEKERAEDVPLSTWLKILN